MQRATKGSKENTKFIYDGQDVLVDDNQGTLTKYQNGLGIDNKLRVQTGSDVNYFLADHLGSTNGLANSSGNLTSSASYDSFGNATGNLNTRYQFTGREFDSISKLHYYRARFYDGKLGRFISEDPIGFGGGDVNHYGYVYNNPVSFSDALGLAGDDFKSFVSHDLGQGWWARVDPYGPDGFEIHVYSPQIKNVTHVSQLKNIEAGVVSGRYGWFSKHNKPPFRPVDIPDDVVNKLNGLNVEKLRSNGIIPQSGEFGFKDANGNWIKDANGNIDSGNIRGGRYLFSGRTMFCAMGGAINVIGFLDGLLMDYDVNRRANRNGISFGQQFIEDNQNFPYIITPLGILKNPSYSPVS